MGNHPQVRIFRRSGNKKDAMKEKKEMNVEFENTMEAIVNTLAAARLSKDSDNPQVFEVKFKLPGTGYSSRSDFY